MRGGCRRGARRRVMMRRGCCGNWHRQSGVDGIACSDVGGCACAGTYGHYLFQIDELKSYEVLDHINHGDQTFKPGWIRMSIHPTMTNAEVDLICSAIKAVAEYWQIWGEDYVYDSHTNEFNHKTFKGKEVETVNQWFEEPLK